MTVRWYLTRGLAAGALAGVAVGLFTRFITETQIGFALRFEAAASLGAPPGAEPLVARGTQYWGGVAAAVLYGALSGVVLGGVVAALHHRLPGRHEFDRIARVAFAAFVAVVLIPSLKYPPNPPAVGNPDTIGQRTADYLLLLAASTVAVFLTWLVWRRLSERGWDGTARFAASASLLVALVSVLFVAFPANPDPIVAPDNAATPALRIAADAPAPVLAAMLKAARATDQRWIRDPNDPRQPLDLTKAIPRDLVGAPVAVNTTRLVPNPYATVIWKFRLESIGGLALMWVVMAVAFGFLAEAPMRAAKREAMPS